MAATDEKAIHEFPTGTIDDNSLLIMDRPTATPGEYETEKFAVANLGLKLLGGIDFPNNLDTDEQDIFGAINEVNAKAMNIAAEYDETESYSKGDYCIYQNTAYRCIKASGTTTGTFVTADWAQTKVLSEVKANTGAISELKENQDSLGDMILNLYNTNTQYYRGDTVEFYGVQYKCIQTPPSAGYSPSGSPAYWSVENLSAQLSDIARCMSIRETFAANTSIISALGSIITKYGKNSLMGGFVITEYGFVSFSLSFSDDGQGGGYVVANNKGTGGNTPVMYMVQYVNGTVSLGYFS